MTASTSPASPPPESAAPSASRRRGDPILWLLVGIFAAYLAVHGLMMWLSLRDGPQLVTSDYYAQSRVYDKELAAQAASARTGWYVELDPVAAAPGEVALRIRDREQRPVSGLSGTISAYRPSDARLDQSLVWKEDAASPGLYRGRFVHPLEGLWQITLDLRRGGERFYEHIRYVAPECGDVRPSCPADLDLPPANTGSH